MQGEALEVAGFWFLRQHQRIQDPNYGAGLTTSFSRFVIIYCYLLIYLSIYYFFYFEGVISCLKVFMS